MNQADNFLSRVVEWPWRSMGWVCAMAFIVASVCSGIFAVIFFPKAPLMDSKSSVMSMSTESYADLGRRDSLAGEATREILRRNIFNSEGKIGDASAGAGSEEVVLSDKAVETTLPIKIKGIIYGGNPYNGLVTIENTELRKINSFVVGDTVMSSAKIKEILPTRIILDRDGRIEYAELEEFKLTRNKRRQKKAAVAGPAAIAKGPAPESYREEGFVREGGDIKITEDYKRRLLNEDFTKTLQDAKATPHKNELGEIAGFRLTRIREDSVYLKAGFQNDDIVEEINGVPLNSVSGAISLLQKLRNNESNIEVRVKRGGQSLTFNLEIQ